MTWEPPKPWEPSDEFDQMVDRMSDAELPSLGDLGEIILMMRRLQRDLMIRCLFLNAGYKEQIVDPSEEGR